MKGKKTLPFSCFLFFCLFFRLSFLVAEDFTPGKIIENVVCLHDAGQSYALYLPAVYREGVSWPVLYCFDPGGNGIVPVTLFRDGAEKYGFILVGSNNSRNGPWADVLQAVKAIWRDSRERLDIDMERVYAAGFSGGARAACGMGKMLDRRLAGIIACGGGLPEWLQPADLSGVPWFGTAGFDDFNYREMTELARQLQALGVPHRLETFFGRHQWPPKGLCTKALAWLDGLAQKSGESLSDD